MAATSAIVSWAGGATGSTRRPGPPGHGRPRLPRGGRDGPLGARRTWRSGAASSRPADGRASRRRCAFGETSETDRLDPAAAVGPRRGRAPRRRPRPRGRASAATRSSGPGAVGERVLLAPVRRDRRPGAQAAGRPAEASALAGRRARRTWRRSRPSPAPALDARPRAWSPSPTARPGSPARRCEAAVRGWDEHGRVWEADLGPPRPRPVPRPLEPVRRGAARWRSTRADARRGSTRRPLAARADALQRMARGHVAVDEPWRPLTAREFAVARLIAEGLTNAEIADVLGIAPKTASSHVEHILAKLGASRRAEIASWASHVERSPLATDPPAGRPDPRPSRNRGVPERDGTIAVYQSTVLRGPAPNDRGPAIPTPEGISHGHRHPRPPTARIAPRSATSTPGATATPRATPRCATCSAARAPASPR